MSKSANERGSEIENKINKKYVTINVTYKKYERASKSESERELL